MLIGLPYRAGRRCIERCADFIVGPKNWRRWWWHSIIGLVVRMGLACAAVMAVYAICVLVLVLVIPPVRERFISEFDGGIWSLDRLVRASARLSEPPGEFPGLGDYPPDAGPYGSFSVHAEQRGRGGKWGDWSAETTEASFESEFTYMDGWEQRVTAAQREWIDTVLTGIINSYRPPLLVGSSATHIEIAHPRGYWHNLVRFALGVCGWVAGFTICLWMSARHIEKRAERASGCPRCGYSRVGLASDRCPECGTR